MQHCILQRVDYLRWQRQKVKRVHSSNPTTIYAKATILSTLTWPNLLQASEQKKQRLTAWCVTLTFALLAHMYFSLCISGRTEIVFVLQKRCELMNILWYHRIWWYHSLKKQLEFHCLYFSHKFDCNKLYKVESQHEFKNFQFNIQNFIYSDPLKFFTDIAAIC